MAEFSGGIQIGSGQWDMYSLILRINEISYSVENNTSYVEWWVGIRSNTQYHTHNGIPETFKVSVNGTQVLDQSFTPNVPVNTLVGVKSGAVAISHDADGSKTISVSASFSGSNSGYYAPITGSCSGTVKLTTIPRASTPSINKPSLDCGDTITISGTSASSNFSHKVYVAWNGTTTYLGTIASGTTSPSFSYTIPTDWEMNLPNSTSGIATFTLETFSASTSVGSKTVNATIKVRSGIVPSIGTVSISDTNSICTGIGQYVQNQSKLKFSIVTSGNQGSTITSVSTKFNGQTYSGSTFTTQAIQNSGTLSYTITVTDSRGRTATKSGSVSVTTYSPPSLTNVSAKRANSSYAVDESSGTYALLHFKVGFTSLSNKNVTSFYIQYRASGTSSWTKINSWDNNYTLEQDYKAGNLFTSTTSTYEIAFGVKDKFMSDYSWQIVTVTPTYTLINFGSSGKSVALFAQSSNKENTLEINGTIKLLVNNVMQSINSIVTRFLKIEEWKQTIASWKANVEEGNTTITLNRYSNYSEKEIDTHTTWIDGKAIYKKTVKTGLISSGTKQKAHGIENLVTVVKMEGIAISYTRDFVVLPRGHKDNEHDGISLQLRGDTIYIVAGAFNEFADSYITVYYTKE